MCLLKVVGYLIIILWFECSVRVSDFDGGGWLGWALSKFILDFWNFFNFVKPPTNVQSLPLLIPTFMWGRCTITYTPACSMAVHFISRQYFLFDIIPHSVQPSSLRSSSLPSLLVLSFPSPPFLRSVPVFSSHAHTSSTSFPGVYSANKVCDS